MEKLTELMIITMEECGELTQVFQGFKNRFQRSNETRLETRSWEMLCV